MDFLKEVWDLFILLHGKDFDILRFECEGRKVTLELKYHKCLLEDNIINSMFAYMRTQNKKTGKEIKEDLMKLVEKALKHFAA